ncbi:MAG: MBOAT family protein, partial [Oscillospiraceae bacterium]
MVFSTLLFIFKFLVVTLTLYYIVPGRFKNAVLFVCSLVFYSWGEVKYFPVMCALILINYISALLIKKFDENQKMRTLFLVISIIGSVGM